MFRDVEAKWPGSTHDSFVFADSRIRQRFEDRELDGVLVGDSGYARKPYMLVPYGRPSTEAEEAYNRAHAKTRVCVERAFGVLKSRFRCLHSSGGALAYDSGFVCRVTMACCMLHNMARKRALPDPVVIADELADAEPQAIQNAAVFVDPRDDTRARIVRDRFTRS